MESVFWPKAAFFITLLFFAVYSILDGFALGIGCFVPLVRKREDSDRLVSYMAPFWEANEVWLVMGAGFMFAAFPAAYAAVLSTFYLPFMATIGAFILRAAGLEFSYHDEVHLAGWRLLLGVGSALAAFSGMVALGFMLQGLPFTAAGVISGDMTVSAFPVALGLSGVLFLAWHGITYAVSKGFDFPREAALLWYAVLGTSAVTAGLWLKEVPGAMAKPAVWAGGAMYVMGLVVSKAFSRNGGGMAFLESSLAMVGLWVSVAASLFPNILVARNNSAWSLTIYQAAAPSASLRLIVVIMMILIPLIFGYSYFIQKAVRRPGRIQPPEGKGAL